MEIPAGQFKARCLQLMDQVQAGREEIIITKRGKPVAKLVPYAEKTAPLLGYLEGSVTIVGDIVAPIDMVWDVDTEG